MAKNIPQPQRRQEEDDVGHAGPEDRYTPTSAVPPEQRGAPAEEQKPPEHATPTPVDPGGPVPRVIKPLERAVAGLKRFKLRSDAYGGGGTLYVLARNEDEARTEYLKASGLEAKFTQAKKASKTPDQVEAPLLVCKELPD